MATNKIFQIPLFTREVYDYILNENPNEVPIDKYTHDFGLVVDEIGEFKLNNFRNIINISLSLANRMGDINNASAKLYVIDKHYISYLKKYKQKHSDTSLKDYLIYMDINNKNTEYKFKKENFYSHFLIYYYPLIALLKPKQSLSLILNKEIQENIKQHLSKFINKKNIYVHDHCFLLESQHLLISYLKNCAANSFNNIPNEASTLEKQYVKNASSSEIAANILVPIIIKVPKIPLAFNLKDYENSIHNFRKYNYYANQKQKEYLSSSFIDENIGKKYNNLMKNMEKEILNDIFTPYTISQYYSFPCDLESCFYDFNPDVNIYFTNSLSTVENVISNIDIFLSKI